MNFTIMQFNLIFTLDAFPNIIFPLFSGILIDKILGI